MSGRAASKRRAGQATTGLVRAAGSTGYFREYAGRCLVYLITPPRSAVVFVETASGRFSFTADATGRLSANADVRRNGQLRLLH